jgi:hypothetical protein
VAVFWDAVLSCNLVEVYRCFKGAYCLHHQDEKRLDDGNSIKTIAALIIRHISLSNIWPTVIAAIPKRRIPKRFAAFENIPLPLWLPNLIHGPLDRKGITVYCLVNANLLLT